MLARMETTLDTRPAAVFDRDHLAPEEIGIGRETLAQMIAILDEIEDLQGSGRNDRRQRVGEEVGPGTLPAQVDGLVRDNRVDVVV